MEYLDHVYFDNTVRQMLWTAGLAIASFVILRAALALIRGQLTRLAQRTSNRWDDIVVLGLSETKGVLVFGIALSLAARALNLAESVDRFLAAVTGLLLLTQGGIWAGAILSAWLKSARDRKISDDPAAATALTALDFLGKLTIWAVVFLLGLDNLGINVTALVAGLGVGGIAVALAAQSILGDLFASISIVLDRPFVLGDFLIVGEHLGAVEHIGLRTTRLRSLSGEQLVFSNTDLLAARIKNYGRMLERRVAFGISVTYQTDPENLRRIPEIIRSAIEARENTRFDRSHFKEFGDSSLNFESVYYVLGRDYNLYMDIQQAINLELCEAFAALGIDFAYPTRTVYVTDDRRDVGAETPAT